MGSLSYITQWLPGHKSSLNWPKKTKLIPKNTMFHSGRGPDRCYIGNKPLLFIKWRLKRGICTRSQNNSYPTLSCVWSRQDKMVIFYLISSFCPYADPNIPHCQKRATWLSYSMLQSFVPITLALVASPKQTLSFGPAVNMILPQNLK